MYPDSEQKTSFSFSLDKEGDCDCDSGPSVCFKMNLRDLIYSQSQSSQKLSQAADDQPNNAFGSYSLQAHASQQQVQGPADPQYDISALFQREIGENQDDVEPQLKR